MKGNREEEEEQEEPVTPTGRLFLRPEMDQVINCVIGLKNPVDVDAIKDEVKNSIMIQHPRFCSLLVRDKHGKEHWRRTQLELEKHVFVREINSEDEYEDEEVVNNYLADLTVSSPLNTDKPLWEIYIIPTRKCFILRIHHALGDGISLMSLFLSCCRRVDEPDQMANISSSSAVNSVKKNKRNNRNTRSFYLWRKAWWLVVALWFNLVFIGRFIVRCLWVKDKKTVVSGGAGVELWPRQLATARFKLDDMKAVKKSISNATINDVLFGVISCGLSRYLDLRSPKKPREGLQITGVAMVNIRTQPGLQDLSKLMESKPGSRWGNQFGIILLPVYYHKDVDDPLQYVKRAKAMVDKKKQSLEAHFSYRVVYFVMSLLGSKVTAWLNYRIVCNTSFTISNIVGPQEEIMVGRNPVTYIRVTSSSLPHAITMHMLSYAGRADMQILVAKDIIPDPQVLAKCFEDALLEMKDAAAATAKIKEANVS